MVECFSRTLKLQAARLLANKNADICPQFSSLGTSLPKFEVMVKPGSGGEGRQEWRSSHAHEEGSLHDAATDFTMP